MLYLGRTAVFGEHSYSKLNVGTGEASVSLAAAAQEAMAVVVRRNECAGRLHSLFCPGFGRHLDRATHHWILQIS